MVCKIGRDTSEAFAEEWYVMVDNCTHFFPVIEDEQVESETEDKPEG
jgi:hypothetical protein